MRWWSGGHYVVVDIIGISVVPKNMYHNFWYIHSTANCDNQCSAILVLKPTLRHQVPNPNLFACKVVRILPPETVGGYHPANVGQHQSKTGKPNALHLPPKDAKFKYKKMVAQKRSPFKIHAMVSSLISWSSSDHKINIRIVLNVDLYLVAWSLHSFSLLIEKFFISSCIIPVFEATKIFSSERVWTKSRTSSIIKRYK